MNNSPGIRELAATLGLAAFLSLGAVACGGSLHDDSTVGTASADGAIAVQGASQDHDDHGDRVADDHSEHDPAAVAGTHAAVMGLVEPSNATQGAAANGDWSAPDTWSGGPVLPNEDLPVR